MKGLLLKKKKWQIEKSKFKSTGYWGQGERNSTCQRYTSLEPLWKEREEYNNLDFE